jgi:hypothetical protein
VSPRAARVVAASAASMAGRTDVIGVKGSVDQEISTEPGWGRRRPFAGQMPKIVSEEGNGSDE